MNPRWARRLVGLYPRAWRERYGEEFEALLAAGQGDLRATFNVIVSALREHAWPTQGGTMDQQLYTFGTVTRQPLAWIPLTMSLIALSMVLGHVAIYGVVHEADEGAVAHLWQILMAAQMPVLLFFAVKWLRRAARLTVKVMALQAGAVLANLAVVFFLT